MSEADWLRDENPATLIISFHFNAPDRKLRLFACACCRAVWELMDDEACRNAVETAEAFADGVVGREELRSAYRGARRATTAANKAALFAAVHPLGGAEAIDASTCALDAASFGSADMGARYAAESTAHCTFARDIFGNPFRPVALDPAWRTEAVVALAAGIYDRAFDRLPVLADALEDAGCADPQLLGHCRGPGPHVRGCWVVDLLLGKT